MTMSNDNPQHFSLVGSSLMGLVWGSTLPGAELLPRDGDPRCPGSCSRGAALVPLERRCQSLPCSRTGCSLQGVLSSGSTAGERETTAARAEQLLCCPEPSTDRLASVRQATQPPETPHWAVWAFWEQGRHTSHCPHPPDTLQCCQGQRALQSMCMGHFHLRH